jgi:hypothetical protein
LLDIREEEQKIYFSNKINLIIHTSVFLFYGKQLERLFFSAAIHYFVSVHNFQRFFLKRTAGFSFKQKKKITFFPPLFDNKYLRGRKQFLCLFFKVIYLSSFAFQLVGQRLIDNNLWSGSQLRRQEKVREGLYISSFYRSV